MAKLDSLLLICLFGILPLEHVPALRNALCSLIGLRGIWLLIKHPNPSFWRWSWPLLPWLAWASASYFWSVAPEKTLIDLEHDLWLPMLTFLGTYQVFRHRASLTPLLWAVVCGTLTNAFVTIFGANEPGRALYPLAWANYFFTTTGYSSTYALYFSALAIPWAFWQQQRRRALAVSCLALNFLVAVIDRNRIFFVAELALILLPIMGGWIKISRKSVVIVLAATAAILVLLIQINQSRTNTASSNEEGISNLILLTRNDIRPKIWDLWIAKIYESPFFGLGFGRDVPSTSISIKEHHAFTVDPYATLHSHNLFLQTLLETGCIGFVFMVFMLFQLTLNFFRSRSSNKFIALSGLLLMTAMIIKNMTDIFTLFGPAVLFYAALGVLSAGANKSASTVNKPPNAADQHRNVNNKTSIPNQKTVLFLIRDKMGDSLIAANVALLFAKANPEWRVSILMRKAYSHAIAIEKNVEILSYRSGTHASLLAWWWWISGRRFDVLTVMRGYGKRTKDLAQRIPARRKVVHEPFLASLATDVVEMPAPGIEMLHYEPALRVARALDPKLAVPERIRFDALANRWNTAPKQFILVCPLSDEQRRNIPLPAIDALCSKLGEIHPGFDIRVMVRNENELERLEKKPRTPVIFFHDIPGLIEIFLRTAHYYGTDTGLLHLAAAMDLPCTVFFGPTQPHRVIPKGQLNFVALRPPILGTRHCDVKTCVNANCIASAVGNFVARDLLSELPPSLPECPFTNNAPLSLNRTGQELEEIRR